MAINIPKNASNAQKLAMKKLNEILGAIDNELNLLATETTHVEWEYKATQARRRILLTHSQILNSDFDITNEFEQEARLALQNQLKRINKLNEEPQNRKQASQHFSSAKNLNSIKFLLDVRPTEPSDNIHTILKTFAAKKDTLASQQDLAKNTENFVAGKINLTEYAASQNKADRLITQERERIAAQPTTSNLSSWSFSGMISGIVNGFNRLGSWVASCLFGKATLPTKTTVAPAKSQLNDSKKTAATRDSNASATHNNVDNNNDVQKHLIAPRYVGQHEQHANQTTLSTEQENENNASLHNDSPLLTNTKKDSHTPHQHFGQ